MFNLGLVTIYRGHDIYKKTGLIVTKICFLKEKHYLITLIHQMVFTGNNQGI